MSLFEDRMKAAQEQSLGKRVKGYLEKRESGATFTAAAIGEALGLPRSENQSIVRLLHNACKSGYLKRLDPAPDAAPNAPAVFRLDRDGDWNPRDSGGSVDLVPGEADGEQGATDDPDKALLREEVERRVMAFLNTLMPGSKFSARHVGERLAYHTTEAHNIIMQLLLRSRKEGWLKSMPGAGTPTFEIMHKPKTKFVGLDAPQPGLPPEPAPEPEESHPMQAVATLPVALPKAAPGLAELQEQLLTIASSLENFRSPLSAYTTAELAEEIARRLREGS